MRAQVARKKFRKETGTLDLIVEMMDFGDYVSICLMQIKHLFL